MSRPPITPETKVGDLLRDYPELEETLVSISPEFQRLRNPVLRATVAKVATLQQVARVGEVAVANLVNTLRRAADGHARSDAPEEEHGRKPGMTGAETGTAASGSPPEWFDPAAVVGSLDARPILEAGEHPASQVQAAVRVLAAGQIFELVTPFEPAPLIERISAQGFDAWSRHSGNGTVHTYFRRRVS